VDGFKKYVISASTLDWKGTEGFLPIVRRAALRRQWDALDVATDLATRGRGDVAVSLIRPACEELFWLCYFNKIGDEKSEEVLAWWIPNGLQRDLDAQHGEVGPSVMTELGLGAWRTAFDSQRAARSRRIRELGKELGWSKRAVERGTLPSVSEVATFVDKRSTYDFLYHATSRYVHFSPVELARRGWGRPGKLEIDPKPYEPSWAVFSLSWGSRLFLQTVEAVQGELERFELPELPTEIDEAVRLIASASLVPLVTAEELIWPS
jgi:hypothetical protein